MAKINNRIIFFFFLPQVRLNLGVYIVFLLDWLTVFNKEQILVLRLEDYAANLRETIKKVFDFLSLGMCPESYHSVTWARAYPDVHFPGWFLHCLTFAVGPLSKQVEAALTKRPMSNTRRVEDRKLGPMFPATKDLLRRFHQPFNQELANLLNNKGFLWSNTWRSMSTDEIWIDVNEQSEQKAKSRNACYKTFMCMKF